MHWDFSERISLETTHGVPRVNVFVPACAYQTRAVGDDAHRVSTTYRSPFFPHTIHLICRKTSRFVLCAAEASHFAFITSRIRSKSSREEYSIRILPLPLRSVMVTRTPSALCSSCSASLTFGSTMRIFSAFSGG